jgi:hypothetical protein
LAAEWVQSVKIMEAVEDKGWGSRISRRKFVAVGSATLILLLIGVLLFDFRKTVRRMLARDSRQLGLGKDPIDLFMAEAESERYWRQFSVAKRALVNVQYALDGIGIHTPWYGKYLRYRNEITGRFLMSTDLFNQNYRQGMSVSYLGFHNPYKAPCSNPFSALRMTA